MQIIIDTEKDDLSLVRDILAKLLGDEQGPQIPLMLTNKSPIPEDVTEARSLSPVTYLGIASPLNVDLDAEGLPWDERIHASSREKVKNGTWKKKRSVGDALYNQVRLEAQQCYPMPGAVSVPDVSVVHQSIVAADGMSGTVVVGGQPPVPTTAPPIPPIVTADAPPIPTTGAPVTWVDLMKKMGELKKEGKLVDNDPRLNKIAEQFGTTQFALLVMHEDKWPMVMQTLQML